jgi:hypothetical protein
MLLVSFEECLMDEWQLNTSRLDGWKGKLPALPYSSRLVSLVTSLL